MTMQNSGCRTCDICGGNEPNPGDWGSAGAAGGDVDWCDVCISKCPPPPVNGTRTIGRGPAAMTMNTFVHLPFYMMDRADWPKYGFTPAMITGGQPSPGGMAKILSNALATTPIVTLSTKKPKKPKKQAKKGTITMAKTQAPDHDLSEYFWASVELQIEPELSGATSFSGNLLSLKQSKDETVGIIDDGNGGKTIGTISKVVTAVKPSWEPKNYTYDYANLKKEYQELATVVKQAGSALKGHIIVRRGDNRNWFRLTLDNGKVVAQPALLGWTDGTKSPYPEFDD